jgi:hypothetical protein
VQSDYEFFDCPCGSDCWCQQKGCTGHYRIKALTFHQFLGTYVKLWIPANARENIISAVLTGKPFEQRQRNAVPALQWLHQNWSSSLDKARANNQCGLCDPAISIDRSVNNLSEAKMWSQLFYDVLVPFDTESRKKIQRAGYPTANFSIMNRQLFLDLRRLAELHGLGVQDVRRLDLPSAVVTCLSSPPSGQPLSRVLDKIFYSPKPKPHPASPA